MCDTHCVYNFTVDDFFNHDVVSETFTADPHDPLLYYRQVNCRTIVFGKSAEIFFRVSIIRDLLMMCVCVFTTYI